MSYVSCHGAYWCRNRVRKAFEKFPAPPLLKKETEIRKPSVELICSFD